MSVKDKLKSTIAHLHSTKKRLKGCALPQGFYLTTEEWLSSLSPQLGKRHFIQRDIFPSQNLSRQLPTTYGDEIYWQFKLDYGQFSRPPFVLSIENGRFWQDSAVLTPNNYLLSDVSIYMRVNPNSPKQHPVFHNEITPPLFLDKTIAVLSAPGGNTFFHWMIDTLPRYKLLTKASTWFNDIDHFLVNDTVLPFQAESIELLGIPRDKIITSTEYPHIHARRLIVPSFTRHQTCNIGNWVFEFLKHDLCASIELPPSQNCNQRLYISRAKASSRQVINEAEIFNILESKGFREVFLEDLSLLEQIRLFASAEYIIAPHGAGLTNLVFCREGTKVLEIYSPNYVSVSYWNICCQMKLHYYYLFSQPDLDTKHQVIPARLENLQVDASQIKVMLEKMGIK